MTFDRLSPLDATFLHIEDGVTHMHIASVLVLDGPTPTYEAMLDMIRGRLPLLPRYRQVVKFVPFQLGRPVWVDDPHFHLEYHVRHSALPAPGGEAELRRLVGRVMSQQLDRTKPLWEVWAVDGLDDGRWALLSKVHHCMVDGVSGTELLTVMLDSTPEPTAPLPDNWMPQPQPSSTDLMRDAVTTLLRSPYEQVRAVRAATRMPRHALAQAREIGRGIAAMAGLVRPTPLSSLNGAIGPHRRYAWASVTVDDIKTVRKGLGGTFNDVVLAVITSRLPRHCSKRARSRPIASCARSCPCRCGRVTRAARLSATGPSRTRCRRCSRSYPSASPIPKRGCTRLERTARRIEAIEPGGRRGGAHVALRLRAADVVVAGDTDRDEGVAAQRQHRHDERARPADTALCARPQGAAARSRTCRSAARSVSASPSSLTTAR